MPTGSAQFQLFICKLTSDTIYTRVLSQSGTRKLRLRLFGLGYGPIKVIWARGINSLFVLFYGPSTADGHLEGSGFVCQGSHTETERKGQERTEDKTGNQRIDEKRKKGRRWDQS